MSSSMWTEVWNHNLNHKENTVLFLHCFRNVANAYSNYSCSWKVDDKIILSWVCRKLRHQGNVIKCYRVYHLDLFPPSIPSYLPPSFPVSLSSLPFPSLSFPILGKISYPSTLRVHSYSLVNVPVIFLTMRYLVAICK